MPSLPNASVSSYQGSAEEEVPRDITRDVDIQFHNGRQLSITFETENPKRNTRYDVALSMDDVVYLLESIAEEMPGLTETFAKCLSRIIEKNVERVGAIAGKLKSLEVGGYQKTAIEALLRDVKPEKP